MNSSEKKHNANSENEKKTNTNSENLNNGNQEQIKQQNTDITEQDNKKQITMGKNIEPEPELQNEKIKGNPQLKDIKQLQRSKGHYIYDFVKIKVTLNEHYYILSRFLITRMLTLCRIPKQQAQKIAKDVKKTLITEEKYEIQHSEMEKILFQFILKNGFQESHIKRYQMTSNFFRKRVPLLILISGTPRVGKSQLATYLAERLNISNVLQTSIVELMMNTIDNNFFKNKCNLEQNLQTDEEFLKSYKKTCLTIRKGVHADILKCFTEGKPLIIEGYELLPEYYIQKQSNIEENTEKQSEKEQKLEILQNYIENKINLKKKNLDLNLFNISNHVNDKFYIIQPDAQLEDSQEDQQLIHNRQKDLEIQSSVNPVIVPIQLILNQRDLQFNIENSPQIQAIKDIEERKNMVEIKLQNYLKIQQFQLQQSELSTVVPTNFHNLDQTLDTIHDILLDKIEATFK